MTTTSGETLRAREVYRYYQPKNNAKATDTPVPTPTDPGSPYGPPLLPNVTNFNTQQSFSDTALTAFAQLIGLRLTAQRAIVSLIDHENEYFLAESASTLSISGENGAQSAWVSISGARVPRCASLCEQTLRLAPSQDTTAGGSSWYLVPDLQLDENMRSLDCVRGKPYLRFYCGVPLTNLKGINIGCVYVVDDRPRTDFTLDEAQFLTKMAAIIMDHLEGLRAKEEIVRVTMMSHALHAFIEGNGTMDGDWQRLKRYNLPSGQGVGFQWETNKNDDTGSYRNDKKHLGSFGDVPVSLDSQVQPPLQHTGPNRDPRFNFNNSPWSSSSSVPQAQIPTLKSVFDGIESPELNKVAGGRDDEFVNDGFATRLRATFSRASNLVREGMEVDGAVFFDAPFRFYQGRSTLEMDPRRSETTQSDEYDADSDEEVRVETRPGPNPNVLPHSHHSTYSSDTRHSKTRSIPTTSSQMDIKSDILGYSTRFSSSWKNSSSPPRNFTAIDQTFLTALVRRYPQGELFVFDEDGPISPEASSDLKPRDGSVATIVDALTEEKRARQSARKRSEILHLQNAFPEARQIFFVPMHDSTSGCFIGCFAWSTSATRIFTVENHLSYLIAFGHSVMSEVDRLNTLSADRAKGDFISNVSHELRSPLHGILASVEFLADTALDGFQRNLVDTVDICGRTLLDTIEHVLDFSKIKKFGQTSMQHMGVVSILDVSAVIEEVLEGVYAGFEFNGLSSEGLADTTRSRLKETQPIAAQRAVDDYVLNSDLITVIINIDFRHQWKFPTVPGIWRRLAMNIFGNALKYTRSGYIKIKLEAKSMADDPVSRAKRTMVTMTVTDTGKGMTKEFMDKKMFMPFSQEDATAPGTGLGMSIVKQIVDLSGGILDIISNQKTGTKVKLSLPLENCAPPSKDSVPRPITTQENEDSVDSVRRRTGGRTVSILGFDNLSGKSDLQLKASASLKASIAKYATEWFGLKLVPSGEAADIAISNESAYHIDAVSETAYPILLILCSSGARRDIFPSRLHTGQIVEFLSKPCGPHRLAKALLNCLDTEDGTPHTPTTELVIAKGPQIGAEPPASAMVTAGLPKSLRLIGSLQSSIEFSPTLLSLIRTPSSGKNLQLLNVTETSLHARRIASTIASSIDSETLRDLNLGDIRSTSTITPGAILATQTPSISTSLLEVLKPSQGGMSVLPRKPAMLLVEDNPVNMMLLATYMKKNKWEFEKATNGLIALEAFRERPEGFDVIFMDVSMPVMTGYESTRHIRSIETERRLAYEHQNRLGSPYVSATHPPSSFPFDISSPSASSANSASISNSRTSAKPSSSITSTHPISSLPISASNSSLGIHPLPESFDPKDINDIPQLPKLKLNSPALIIALTGFSSQKDQEMAFEAGVDVFMTKPVRFREIGRILEGWTRSWEEAVGVGGERGGGDGE